jgi:phosphate-selective porin OprO/OprP
VSVALPASSAHARLLASVPTPTASNTWSTAWQRVGHWVLSGGDASCRGAAPPNQPFTIDGAGWGAFERVARHGELDIDDEAFPPFANPATAARRAQAWSLGPDGSLTRHVKLVANHTHACFHAGAADGADREETFFTRAQPTF